MRLRTLSVGVLFLLTLHAAVAEERKIFINLIPRGYQDPRMDKDFVCGLDKKLDSQRLIGEQNSMFIFELLDKTRDPTEGYKYKTQIYDVVSFDRDEQAEVMLDKLQCPVDESMPGLLSLFLAPPRVQCNYKTFEDATDYPFGYFPVFVGLSGDDAIIQEFISEAENFKPFYNGQMPKLCGSKVTMNNETAQSRVETLNLLFNIKYNNGQTRNLDPTEWKICESVEQSIEAMEKSDLFEVDPTMSFENQDQTISEMDGFVRAGIIRQGSLAKKAVGFVATSFPDAGGPYSPAGQDDIVTYKGPIVFNKNEENANILITVKEDNKTETMEYFYVEIQDSMVMRQQKRRKRSPGKDAQGKWVKGKGTVQQGPVKINKGISKDKKTIQIAIKDKNELRIHKNPTFEYAEIPPTPPYKCINNNKGMWHWTSLYEHEFVKEKNLKISESPIHFYELMTKQQEDTAKKQSPIPDHLSWDHRCRKQESRGGKPEKKDTLQRSDGSWEIPQNDAEKLAKAALKILDFVVWYGMQGDIFACPTMMQQTVSIAMMKPKGDPRRYDIYIAGNLARPFYDSKWDTIKVNKILDILNELFDNDYKNVYVINPSIPTFGKKVKESHSHAEMQLAKVAMSKNLEVLALGVSKPPCCACNIVLRSVFSDESKKQSTKDFYDILSVNYHKILEDVPVASARGSDRCQIPNDQGVNMIEEWCGSQYNDNKLKGMGGWPNFNKFWEHPVDMIEANIQPLGV